MSRQRSDELIGILLDGKVDFILIGGVAAILHGSSHLTHDVDVLMPFNADNWARVIAALRHTDPVAFGHPSRIPLGDDAERLTHFRMLLLKTTLGRLDILRETPVGTYEELLPGAVTMEIDGRACRVLGLDDLIESKARLMREKDKPVVIELRAIRDHLRARGA